jgi:hypothetical protein
VPPRVPRAGVAPVELTPRHGGAERAGGRGNKVDNCNGWLVVGERTPEVGGEAVGWA